MKSKAVVALPTNGDSSMLKIFCLNENNIKDDQIRKVTPSRKKIKRNSLPDKKHQSSYQDRPVNQTGRS